MRSSSASCSLPLVALAAVSLLLCSLAALPVAIEARITASASMTWFMNPSCDAPAMDSHFGISSGVCFPTFTLPGGEGYSLMVTCDENGDTATFFSFASPNCDPGTVYGSGGGRADGQTCLAGRNMTSGEVVGTATLKCQPACSGKVLVAMSSASQLPLTNEETNTTFNHATGWYLPEAYFPLRSLLDAGWEVTFANPLGNTPPMDALSNDAKYFKGNDTLRKEALELIQSLSNFQNPLTYSFLASPAQAAYLSEFDALLIPGGHAPMVDLWNSPELGSIILSFDSSSKPIGAICHGPVALLATNEVYPPSQGFTWRFTSRSMTVFTDEGDQENEVRWGGDMPFLPQAALAAAGGTVVRSNGVEDSFVVSSGNLVTAENPYSAEQFGVAFAAAVAQFCPLGTGGNPANGGGSSSSSGLSKGQAAGVGIGCALAGAALLGVVIACRRKSQSAQGSNQGHQALLG